MSASTPPPGPCSPRIVDNPFYVLALSPHCSAVQVRRQGEKLLAMLELGLREAASYDTPFGVRVRDTDKVRTAMAQLQDPEQRLVHELWAALDPSAPVPVPVPIRRVGGDHPRAAGRRRGWADAMRLFGWRRDRR